MTTFYGGRRGYGQLALTADLLEDMYGSVDAVIEIPCKCQICHTVRIVKAPVQGYIKWARGTGIQYALPGLTPDERELLLSGICGRCYDQMFGKED